MPTILLIPTEQQSIFSLRDINVITHNKAIFLFAADQKWNIS